MRYTLLEMTQQILLSLDGDEVDSINDTTESLAVAKIIRECYWDLVGQLDLPEHRDFFQLTATSSATPTLMTLPSTVSSLDWIEYDEIATAETDHHYRHLTHYPLRTFLTMVNSLDSDDTTADQFSLTIGSSVYYIKCSNNSAPTFYTTYDDNNILFDSFDSDEDAFLQASKTRCYGQMIPTFTLTDTATPDIDARQFAVLLNEAKAQCWADLKQQINTRAENKVRQNKIDSQKKKQNIGYPDNQDYFNRLPNYGRK